MEWTRKDDMLLREMQLFETRDRQSTGPHDPMADGVCLNSISSPQYDDQDDDMQFDFTGWKSANWGVEHKPHCWEFDGRLVQGADDVLWRELRHRSKLWQEERIARFAAEKTARQYRQAVNIWVAITGLSIVALSLVAAVMGWAR